MAKLIDAAVASKPDGLVVSIPEPGIAPAIRRAVKAGIPVVSINSGSDVYTLARRARARRASPRSARGWPRDGGWRARACGARCA